MHEEVEKKKKEKRVKRHKAFDGEITGEQEVEERRRGRFREVMSLPWQRASYAQSHHQQSQIHLCLNGEGSLASPRSRVKSPAMGLIAARS